MIRVWIITISGAEGTIYAGEKFRLRVAFPDDYPTKPPAVYFLQSPPPPKHQVGQRRSQPSSLKWCVCTMSSMHNSWQSLGQPMLRAYMRTAVLPQKMVIVSFGIFLFSYLVPGVRASDLSRTLYAIVRHIEHLQTGN